MERYFVWLVKHEKLVAAFALVLVIALVAQVKFCQARFEPEVGQPVAHQSSISSDARVEVAGKWEMSVQRRRGGTQTWILTLEQNGEALTGVISSEGGDLAVSGTVKGQVVNFSAERYGATVEFRATCDGTAMTGTMHVLTVTRQWTAQRR